MRHIISIILENESGALSRVIGLFSQRGYNIESLTVAPTYESSLSCITIETFGDLKILEQIKKHLCKLINVLRVISFEDKQNIEREILLIKVFYNNAIHQEIKNNIEIFRGQIINVTYNKYIIQIIGTKNKIDAFITMIKEITKIIEIVRSGVISILRK